MRALKEFGPSQQARFYLLNGVAAGVIGYLLWDATSSSLLILASAFVSFALTKVWWAMLDRAAVDETARAEPRDLPANPPGIAEWLVALVVAKRSSDGLLGDLEERFHRHVETRGLQRAQWLYWAEALRSIAPILWTKAKRLGMIAAIAEIWRRTHS
jgi:hypothetical protein